MIRLILKPTVFASKIGPEGLIGVRLDGVGHEGVRLGLARRLATHVQDLVVVRVLVVGFRRVFLRWRPRLVKREQRRRRGGTVECGIGAMW
jgi:hypothetical protein